MAAPFECSICGLTKSKRTAFPWLVIFVIALYGQGTMPGGPVCSDCAPRLATVGGRILYALIGIGLLVLVYRYVVYR